MEVFEIVGFADGVDNAGVNFLAPADSFQSLINGFIYRQVLQSRMGVGYFCPRLAGQTRIFGIFEFILPDDSKQLMAFDTNRLYRFNEGTGIFNPIPFGGSMAAYAGFNIPAKDLYVSAAAYPTADNLPRFVFCGEGIAPNAAGSAIFFYDGTNVKSFTNLADNPNYAAPPQGPLNSASYVTWFNERINFIVPVIGGIEFNQGTLYSGIRNLAGNGDKFNVAGSGLFQANTSKPITGVTILGQVMMHNYSQLAYTMEITRDAFNPYFGRIVPGTLGTNAKFSAVAWNDSVKSLGRTGILGTDGRQNLRIDNKIPYFTERAIDQPLFNLTYGGFDRLNNQFMWSYKQSGTDSDTQDSVLVYNYEEKTWSVFDQRFSVFGETDIGTNLTWDEIDETSGNASWRRWNTTEEIWDKIGLGGSVQKTLAGDDLGFIYELNQDYDDYYTDISAVAVGATTTVTVDATGILPGDLVTISDVEGMVQLNNFDPETSEQTKELYEVIASTPTTVQINVDSTLFSAYVPGTGNLSKIIEFEAKTTPFNPYRSQGRKVFVSLVEMYIESTGGSVLVDVYADQQSTPFKRDILLKPDLQDAEQTGEWISMSVGQEANFITLVLKQKTPAVQLRITSIRIHCEPGGMTNG
jgi:hypothetical protein